MAIYKYATANCNGKFAYQYWAASTDKNLRERVRKKQEGGEKPKNIQL